jgi:hypothetical protein
LFPFAIVVSPFLIDALQVSPETEKAQPIAVDRLGLVAVCGGLNPAAYCVNSNAFSPPSCDCSFM